MKEKKDIQKKEIDRDEKLEEQIAAKTKEADEYKDKWLRAHADYENLLKRVEKERQQFVKFSTQYLIAELFPIMDSFDSAIVLIEKSNDKESFLKGFRLLQGEFHKILEANGLKKIKTIGEKFNPYLHHAEEEIYTDKFASGIIAEEIRSGYALNEGVLRPALVKVSKGQMKNVPPSAGPSGISKEETSSGEK